MKQLLKSLALALALGSLAVSVSACCGGENKSATAKCRNSAPNANSCQACCKSITGNTSYSYTSSGGCKCF